MVRKQYGDYYLGLDIGTNSVGWAVTDMNYDILRFNGKAMWGIHLFNEGETAEERRLKRCSRRRLERNKQRISLLRELFDSEIATIDPSFFMRLDESSLVINDRKNKQSNSIFNDSVFKDCNYHKEFPTIYHLRKKLIEDDSYKPDVRLLYLAIHHILKNRGHFLFEGLSDQDIPDFQVLFRDMSVKVSSVIENVKIDVCENTENVKNLLLNRSMSLNDKKKIMRELLSCDTKQEKAFADMLVGSQIKISAMIEDLKDTAIKDLSITFKNDSLDENRAQIEEFLNEDQMIVIEMMKSLYDWGVLKSMLDNFEYLSQSKVAEYEQHKEDLKLLKFVLKCYDMEHKDSHLYDTVMKSPNEKGNYCSYSHNVKDCKDVSKTEFCNQDEFCDYLKKILKEFDFSKSDKTKDMMVRIENKTFMPKQRSKDNSVIPNALHRKELKKILDNASKHYSFLTEKDDNGRCIAEKIISLCTFRIPYFIGPLNPASKYSWAVHKSDGRVLPWTFEEKIDIDRSSERFIEKLVSSCKYLVGEKVLPKSSLLYQRFMLYNEINKIKLNGESIGKELKKDLIDALFLKKQTTVTINSIKKFVVSRTGQDDVIISGVDEKIKASLKIEVQLTELFGDKIKDRETVEEIIKDATIFGDDRKRLSSRLNKKYGTFLTKTQIDKVSSMKFNDWGKLSKKFLLDIKHRFSDGREMNILTALEQTNLNLMELLSDKYTYKTQIDALNSNLTGSNMSVREIVDNLYCSPSVKHSILRTMAVIKDILKITGHSPKKIFIETTREEGEKKRTVSRKDSIIEKYKNMKDSDSYATIISQLESTDDARLRSKKIFAYFMQEGHCIYCGKPIDLNEIGNNEVCDIDHIYPQSVKTDDSIDNTVLSCRNCNITKGNIYPIKEDIQNNRMGLWKHLKDNGFMSEEKFKRLTRKYPLTEDELCDFVARQLVETSQSVKATAEILKHTIGNETDIVYVKASNVSKFRNDFKNRGYYTKSRIVNDHHHAKDAYLNIVVGNTYDIKFTKNPLNTIRKENYNLKEIFKSDVFRGNDVAWICGDGGTIRTVDKWMRRDNILFTRNPYKETGMFFKETIMKKGLGQMPQKKGKSIESYGGYNEVKGSYFSLVEHTVKKKRVRTLEFVPIMDSSRLISKTSANAYFVDRGLVEPDVRMMCIKNDAMIEVNGFRASISGRVNIYVSVKNSEQMILPHNSYVYSKNISKFIEKNKEKWKSKIKASDYHITLESNKKMYRDIIDKINLKYDGAPGISSAISKIRDGMGYFEKLSLEDQAICLNNILTIFHCDAARSNLSMIGGASDTGRMLISKTLSSDTKTMLVAQSASGLFERKIDLYTI